MFLNKEYFISRLIQLFNETQEELVLIVPYVKTSAQVYEHLVELDERGVEILMVCREDCLKQSEISKLSKLKHLTLLSHPNLHSKIYLNDYDIIVGSMNLYEYSEQFNREAGFVFPKKEVWDNNNGELCINEIRQIISGSTEIVTSKKVREEGVNFEILSTSFEKLQSRSDILSRMFTTKKFIPLETSEGYNPTCTNFYDNIDVAVSYRVVILPNYPEEVLEKVFGKMREPKVDYYPDFRVYVDTRKKRITVYAAEGSTIDDHIYTNKKYVKNLEKTIMSISKEINQLYTRVLRTQPRTY
ncbi:phospholipase D family protein [Altibacter lentus]|uniref:phospholipase D family protein n=1 Tax=Altibacter lentus TaxID=1223410 RepID=UPI000553E2BC|nr:phospholipase D family protein [Altibacter lentus]